MAHTRFERARIIGARALQLSMGASSFLPSSLTLNDPIEVATSELESRVNPVTVQRAADARD